jgi:hypothetical protein
MILFEFFFRGAKIYVGAGHLGGQEDQIVIIIGNRSFQVGNTRLDGAPELAPEVKFPGRVETDIVNISKPFSRGGIGQIAAGAFRLGISGALLGLRVLIADGNAQLGPGFQNSNTGNLQA